MSGRVFSNIMRWMCVVIEGKKDDCTDAQLLDRFVQKKDETAFELLVRRHGPMVFAVCRREIQEIHEAEDAFQATFLVLVRKAGELRQPDRLASWLHGVAYRVARKARKLSARRRAEPLNLDDVNGPEQVSDLAWKELQYVLNGEIERLPTKFREPVILCYLNGLTYAAAARRLGVPAGTVSAWLDRARELLRARLVRRGLTFSAGMLGTLMAQNAVAAAVPSSL
ncbi:MAG: RNA polymerase sigma factor, partial [Gemmataceae bacterium]